MTVLTHVRNIYCHFRGGGDSLSEKLDGMLTDVQELLVAVGDEERAIQARALRVHLKQAVDQSAAEMEAIGLLSSLSYHNGRE